MPLVGTSVIVPAANRMPLSVKCSEEIRHTMPEITGYIGVFRFGIIGPAGIQINIIGQVKGFSIGNPAGYSKGNAIELKEALADINIPSLFTDRKIVNLISVRGMHVNVESDFNGNNLSKILSNIQNFSSSASEKKKETAPQKEQASENSDKEEKKSGLEIVRLDSENAQVTYKNTIVPQGIVLPLPPIHLNNIGGTNLQDTASQILSQLLSVVSSTANSVDQAVRDIFSKSMMQCKRPAKNCNNSPKKSEIKSKKPEQDFSIHSKVISKAGKLLCKYHLNLSKKSKTPIRNICSAIGMNLPKQNSRNLPVNWRLSTFQFFLN